MYTTGKIFPLKNFLCQSPWQVNKQKVITYPEIIKISLFAFTWINILKEVSLGKIKACNHISIGVSLDNQ